MKDPSSTHKYPVIKKTYLGARGLRCFGVPSPGLSLKRENQWLMLVSVLLLSPFPGILRWNRLRFPQSLPVCCCCAPVDCPFWNLISIDPNFKQLNVTLNEKFSYSRGSPVSRTRVFEGTANTTLLEGVVGPQSGEKTTKPKQNLGVQSRKQGLKSPPLPCLPRAPRQVGERGKDFALAFFSVAFSFQWDRSMRIVRELAFSQGSNFSTLFLRVISLVPPEKINLEKQMRVIFL